jgi:hypothetical protein
MMKRLESHNFKGGDMRKTSNKAALIGLGLGLTISLIFGLIMMNTASRGANAQSTGQSANGPTAPAKTSATTARTSATTEELMGLLPASDLIASVDVGRAFNDLLPRLASLDIGGLEKMAREIQDFTARTGIDPTKVQNAVMGFNMAGTQANGAIIVQGIELDETKIDAAIKSYKAEFKMTEYKGKKIFNIISKIKSPTAGPLSVKTDETAIVSLGQQKMVLGDLNAVKNVIDIHSGEAKGGVTPEMLGALKETKETALVRFALNIPENLRQEAASQGDLFKSVSTIKVILGAFDVSNDFSLALDAIMRTASQNEASELESGLKGLVSLVRGFFSGGDPKNDVFGQLLDQVKIGSKLADVSLSISLPRPLLDQFVKKPANAEKKQ